jgi:hypothetical protein
VRRCREMLTIPLLLLLSFVTGATAEDICTVQKGAIVAPAYADILPVLTSPTTRSDRQTVENAFTMARLIRQGRLTQLPKGTPVEVRGSPLANGAVQIRLSGTSQDFWIVTMFLDCPR